MRALLVLALVVAVAVLAGATPWVAAQVRAVGVVATTAETPVLARLTRAVTGEPRVEEGELAGHPATLFRPAGEADATVLFVNGATALGREEPAVRRLAEGLARTGHLVGVPDLPGLRDLVVTEEAAAATVDAALALLEPGGGRVALVGVSIGGTLALLAAQDERLRGRVAVVTALAPFTDLREVVRLATTGHHRLGDRLVPHATDPFVREVVTDSLRALAGEPAAAAALANDDPARFDELYASAPASLRGPLERLSPVREAERLETRVELVTGPDDPYFPPGQMRLLVERAPDARLTLTRAFDHSELDLDVREVRGLLRFDRAVVRTLVEARR